ncbi:MAG TPA: PAS domain S-box protein [Deltaproteobacteria bacterium]|nr:PAS domain S-box protein [Deltaproteobacteria bacterium]
MSADFERRKFSRRQSDEDLRISEEKYRNILESITEGYYEVDLAGNYTFYNDSLCRILGYSREEMTGMSYKNYTDKENAKKLFAGFNEIYKTGIPTKIVDYEIIRKDGEKRHMETSASLLKDSSGNPVGFRGVVRDVTERIKQQEALRQSEEKYRNILESIREGYFELDLEGNYIFANESNCRFLGYTKEELIGKNYRIHTSQEAAEKLYQPYRELYKTGKPIESVELESFTKEGNKVIHETSVSLIRDDKGKPVGFRGVSRDVTARRQIEEELRKNEEKYRTIIESIQDGYFELDLSGKYTFVNDAICRHLGYTREELIGSDSRRPQDEANARKTSQAFRELYRSGEPIKALAAEYRKKDGTKGYYEMSASLIKDAQDKPIGFRGVSRDITERKKAEEVLRASEEKYRTIIETMQDGYLEMDLSGRYTFANKVIPEHLGYSHEELIGATARAFQDEENYKKTLKSFIKIYNTGKPAKSLEVECIRKDGTKGIYELSSTLMTDAQGKPVGFSSISRDITERKKMEEELRKSEEKYRTILESIDDGYYEIDLQGNYTFFNDAEARNLGYTREEMMGMNSRKYQDEETYKRTFQAFMELYRTGEPIKALEMEAVRKDKTKVFNEISASLLRDELGRPIGFRGITRNVSARKQMEDALRLSEERYRTILDEMEEGYFELDLAGNTTFFNDSICTIFGYPPEESLGLNYKQYTDKENAGICFKVYNEIYKTGIPGMVQEYEIIRKDKTKRYVETSASLRRDSSGKIVGFRGISRDITERKRVEEALKKSRDELIKKNKELEESRRNVQITLEKLGSAYEELKTTQAKIIQQEKMASIGQLAAGVAHEINNPVSFIASNLGTLNKYIGRFIDFMQAQTDIIKGFKSPDVADKMGKKRKQLKIDYLMEDVQKLVQESLDGTERVQKIVQSLNRFSRVDDADYRKTDINECLEQSINIVWNELKHKATLHKDYGKIPATKCYPQQLSQVFINLLLNASQAIAEKGEIKIKTWGTRKEIWVSISDTGEGISPEKITKVFEPFFTTKEVGKGTGLGLSISYEIIQQHKGDISVESTEGKGTTFTVKIPVVS